MMMRRLARSSIPSLRRAGQTTVEYTLLAALFMTLSYWFAQRLLFILYRIFHYLIWDLSGPGI